MIIIKPLWFIGFRRKKKCIRKCGFLLFAVHQNNFYNRHTNLRNHNFFSFVTFYLMFIISGHTFFDVYMLYILIWWLVRVWYFFFFGKLLDILWILDIQKCNLENFLIHFSFFAKLFYHYIIFYTQQCIDIKKNKIGRTSSLWISLALIAAVYCVLSVSALIIVYCILLKIHIFLHKFSYKCFFI